jgi:hypothetical protein
MITPKIKDLFQFIEYLHSNIENFNQYNNLIKELETLKVKKNKLKPELNYKDKLEYKKVQAELKSKFKALQDNTANLIKTKAKELNVCNFDNEPNYSFNGIEVEIQQLKEGFSKRDLSEIFKSKEQYIGYRNKTHKTFFSLEFFFDELDEITKSMFDYFKETQQNEFEAFEKKTIEVNSIEEAIQIFTNKENKDERFWLNSFFDEQEQTNPIYKSYKYQIDNHGCFILNNVKVYTPELVIILVAKDLPALNMENKALTTINGWKYLQTYIESYKEGEQYFENEFKVSPNTLYGANAEQYVRDIHFNFFHVQHTGANEGWSYVKKQYPIILTHKAVREFGYYSGIVNKVEEQVKKYPKLFSTFDKCEHNLSPQPINSETDTEKLTAKHYVLAYLFECNAKGESYPVGNKKELERIGNKRMEAGKGNTFYKVFNNIIRKDINVKKNLIEIGGEYWRKAVIKLTEYPELVEEYLHNKHL